MTLCVHNPKTNNIYIANIYYNEGYLSVTYDSRGVLGGV